MTGAMIVFFKTETHIFFQDLKNAICHHRPCYGSLSTLCHVTLHWWLDIISYPLFADADTGIYPHAASQYHARPKAKHGIAMLSVDKFPYPWKQTRGKEFIHAQTMFIKFWNVSAALKFQIPLLSGQNHRIITVLLDRITAVRKEDGGGCDRHCDVINDVPFPLYLTLMTSNVRYAYILNSS